jgi:hypothetical protein
MAARAGNIRNVLAGGLTLACREFELEGQPAEENHVESLLRLNLLHSLTRSSIGSIVRVGGTRRESALDGDVPGEQTRDSENNVQGQLNCVHQDGVSDAA